MSDVGNGRPKFKELYSKDISGKYLITNQGFNSHLQYMMRLNSDDLLLLRWFLVFRDSGNMIKKVINGRDFFWVSYRKALDDLPQLYIQSKDAMKERFKKLCGNFEDANTDIEYPLVYSDAINDEGVSISCYAVNPIVVTMQMSNMTGNGQMYKYTETIQKPTEFNPHPDIVELCNLLPSGAVKVTKGSGEYYASYKNLSKWYNQLLDGSFVETNMSQIKKYSTVGKITKEEIFKACIDHRKDIELSSFFFSYATKQSKLLYFIVKNRTLPERGMSDKPKIGDDTTIKYYKEGIQYIEDRLGTTLDETMKDTLYQTHLYLIRNHKDLASISRNDNFTYEINYKGLKNLASWIVQYIKTKCHNKIPDYWYFKIGSEGFKAFARYLYSARKLQIILDEGFYRQLDEYNHNNHALNDIKPTDFT